MKRKAMRLGCMAAVCAAASFAGCSTTPASDGGSGGGQPQGVYALATYPASAETTKTYGVTEWRAYKGVHQLVMTGYDAQGRARSGVQLAWFTKTVTTPGHLRVLMLDGSATAVRRYVGGKVTGSLSTTQRSLTAAMLRDTGAERASTGTQSVGGTVVALFDPVDCGVDVGLTVLAGAGCVLDPEPITKTLACGGVAGGLVQIARHCVPPQSSTGADPGSKNLGPCSGSNPPAGCPNNPGAANGGGGGSSSSGGGGGSTNTLTDDQLNSLAQQNQCTSCPANQTDLNVDPKTGDVQPPTAGASGDGTGNGNGNDNNQGGGPASTNDNTDNNPQGNPAVGQQPPQSVQGQQQSVQGQQPPQSTQGQQQSAQGQQQSVQGQQQSAQGQQQSAQGQQQSVQGQQQAGQGQSPPQSTQGQAAQSQSTQGQAAQTQPATTDALRRKHASLPKTPWGRVQGWITQWF